MAQSSKRTEILVGFFLFVGLALLGLLIMQFGRLSERFQGVYTVTVSFTDAAGVIKGSSVRLAGAKVGQVVEEPQLTEDGRVLVTLVIRNTAPPIDKNANFQITSLSLLGDKAITITPPGPDEEPVGVPLQDGAFIEGGGPSGLEALQSDAETIASNAAVLMARGRSTLTKIDNVLDELRTVSGLLGESIQRVNNGLLDDDNVANFKNSLANLNSATENIQEASVEIKPLLVEAQAAIDTFDNAAVEAEGAFAQASSELGRLRPTLEKVPTAVDSIAGVADEARETLETIKSNDGLLGTLTKDESVTENAKRFLRNLREYGILRYKDESTYDERDPRNRFRGRRR